MCSRRVKPSTDSRWVRPGIILAASSPLVLAAAVTAGAGALLLMPQLPSLPWFAFAALPTLLPWRGRALYAAICLGFLLTGWQAQRGLAQRWPVARDGQIIAVRGAIASLPQRVDGYGNLPSWRFRFVPDARQSLPPRIRVAWYRSTAVPHGGQCWQFDLKLKAPHGSADPGAFDYEGWLFAKGIGATGTVKAAASCGVAVGYGWLRLREDLRQHLDRWLTGVPGHALVNTMILGDRSRLSQADWRIFRATGTSHLVAVAGLHLAIISGAAFFLFRWLWVLWPALALRLPAQKAGLIGAALAGVTYAALTGFALPALRATLMLLAAVVALLLGSVRSLPRALALVWLAIVLVDPLALLGASIWLSFGAVALIAWVSAGRIGPHGRLRELLVLQLGLSLGLIPLTLWFFGGASWVAPLANLFVVPAATLLLPALFVALGLTLVSTSIGLPLLKIMSWAWWALFQVLDGLATHAPQAWIAASAEPVVLLLALFGVLLLLAPRGVPLRLLGLICLLPLLWVPDRSPPTGHFRLTVLDVGQGLSAVVRTHRHSLLFDAGPAWPGGLNMGEAVVLPYLHQRGIGRLSMMLISHYDLDHRGGAKAVRAGIPIDAELGAVAPVSCRDGQHWRWDNVEFRILNPPPGAHDSRNNLGCVLLVTAGTHAALLPADIEAPAEHALIQRHADILHADVLIAPHHGSAGSSTPPFVADVHPHVTIYPAGWENQFHFPRPEPEARYAAVGAVQYQTGTDGAVSVEVGPDGVGPVRRWRRQRPRLWQTLPSGATSVIR